MSILWESPIWHSFLPDGPGNWDAWDVCSSQKDMRIQEPPRQTLISKGGFQPRSRGTNCPNWKLVQQPVNKTMRPKKKYQMKKMLPCSMEGCFSIFSWAPDETFFRTKGSQNGAHGMHIQTRIRRRILDGHSQTPQSKGLVRLEQPSSPHDDHCLQTILFIVMGNSESKR